MNEQYRLEAVLAENLYQEGAPLLISRAELLREAVSRGLAVRLHLRNITDQPITGAGVKIVYYDKLNPSVPLEASGMLTPPAPAYRDVEFGEQQMVPLEVRDISNVTVTLALFTLADGQTVTCPEEPWEPLPAQRPLGSALKVPGMLSSFQAKAGTAAVVTPMEARGLWGCVCGEVNHSGEGYCHKCGKSLTEYKQMLDSQEKVMKEEQEKYRRRKRTLRLALILLPCLIVLAVGGFFLTDYLQHNGDYEAAISLANQGSYDEAKEIFIGLGSYKDSPELVYDMDYRRATDLYEAGGYEEAAEIFDELYLYKDSRSMEDKCYYEKFKKAMGDKDYDTATEMLELLPEGYGDTGEILNATNFSIAMENSAVGNHEKAYEIISDLAAAGYTPAQEALSDFHYLPTYMWDSDHDISYTYFYNLAGNVDYVEIDLNNGDTATRDYTYDESGNVISMNYLDSEGTTGQRLYTYDEKNRLVKTETKFPKTSSADEFTYPEEGNLAIQQKRYVDGELTYTIENTVTADQGRYVSGAITYADGGTVSLQYTYLDDGTESYQYEALYMGEVIQNFTYRCDSQGNLKEFTTQEPGFEPESTILYYTEDKLLFSSAAKSYAENGSYVTCNRDFYNEYVYAQDYQETPMTDERYNLLT